MSTTSALPPVIPVASPRDRNAMLLGCGIASSVVYVVANAIGSMAWPEYSSASQTISELSAIDAPSRATWIPFGLAYNALLIAFGVGVWRSAHERRLRIASVMLIAIGALGPLWPPMHLRGSASTMTDTLHVAFAGATSLLILVAIVFAATALGPRFRRYSIATFAVMVLFGVLTSFGAPHLAANLPTPWIGVYERLDLAAFLLWVSVLGIALLRDRR